MPQLRILILDSVDVSGTLSGFELPCLAMLSWQNIGGPSLPFVLKTVKSAAVLDISGSENLEKLPADLQACSPICFFDDS